MAQSADDFKISGMAITFSFIAAALLIATGVITAFYGGWELLFGGVERDTERLITLSARSWGAVHFGFGILLALAGCNVLSGKTWARAVAIVIAVALIGAAIASIPENPVFSLFLVVSNAMVIWALAFHGRDITTVTQ